jgi:hypothetical protein
MLRTDVRSIGVVHVAAGARNIRVAVTVTGNLGRALDINEVERHFVSCDEVIPSLSK